MALGLPARLFFLRVRHISETGWMREWLDSDQVHDRTRVERADLLTYAAAELTTPVVILASPRLAEFLTANSDEG